MGCYSPYAYLNSKPGRPKLIRVCAVCLGVFVGQITFKSLEHLLYSSLSLVSCSRLYKACLSNLDRVSQLSRVFLLKM